MDDTEYIGSTNITHATYIQQLHHLLLGNYSIVLALGPSEDYLPTGKEEDCGLWVSQPHYYGGETGGGILGIAGTGGYLHEVDGYSKVIRAD